VTTLLAIVAGASVAQAGDPPPASSSVVFTKTVGTNPDECATNNLLPQVPEDGIVYYCYQMTYSGAISASCHSLIDSVLGSVLNQVPGGRCCTNASAAICDPDPNPDSKCEVASGGFCGNPDYPVCAAVTFSGVCCNDEEGIDCVIPNEGCDDDNDCVHGNYCVTHPIVADGETVTRVITATVPPQGVANQATWTAEAGVCCDDTENTCDGDDNPLPCATNEDCFGSATCRKEGIGLCCTSSSATDCDLEAVCVMGKECDDEEFDTCVPVDTSAEAESAARVGVFETPVVSATGMALLVLVMAGFGLFRVNRTRQHA
jgi:hypothetical protein